MSTSSLATVSASEPTASTPREIRAYLRSPNVASKLRRLQRLSTLRFCAQICLDYGAIAAAIALAIYTWGHAWFALTYPFAVLVIAARQHALAILMHEATHYLASPNRQLNDWLGSLFCATPILANMQNYRRAHLAHHAHLNTPSDPDWQRKTHSPEERRYWDFPTQQSPSALFIGLYKRSIGHLFIMLKENSGGDRSAHRENSFALSTRVRSFVYALIVITLSITNTWLEFVFLWVLPMFLVLPMILRVRSIAEHFALSHAQPLQESRNIEAGSVERFLLGPHNIGLHLDHHLVASVPLYNVPALHQLLLQCPYYRANAQINDGYLWGNNTLLNDMYHKVSSRLQPVLAG